MDDPPIQDKAHNYSCITMYRHIQIKKLLRIMNGLNVHYITPL